MSMSNYALLALDEQGKPSDGKVTSPRGVTAEIYKNWLYVGDKKAWREGGAFIKPTVMQVTSGELVYCDLYILALRGPQFGVYVVAYYRDKDDVRGMVGCGVEGYEYKKTPRTPHPTDWVGVTEESLAWFARELARERDGDQVPECFSKANFRRQVRSR
jgi:hypothetical protein